MFSTIFQLLTNFTTLTINYFQLIFSSSKKIRLIFLILTWNSFFLDICCLGFFITDCSCSGITSFILCVTDTLTRKSKVTWNHFKSSYPIGFVNTFECFHIINVSMHTCVSLHYSRETFNGHLFSITVRHSSDWLSSSTPAWAVALLQPPWKADLFLL